MIDIFIPFFFLPPTCSVNFALYSHIIIPSIVLKRREPFQKIISIDDTHTIITNHVMQ
jgi:hypothetical protein